MYREGQFFRESGQPGVVERLGILGHSLQVTPVEGGVEVKIFGGSKNGQCYKFMGSPDAIAAFKTSVGEHNDDNLDLLLGSNKPLLNKPNERKNRFSDLGLPQPIQDHQVDHSALVVSSVE